MSQAQLLGALSEAHHDLLLVLAIDRHRATLGFARVNTGGPVGGVEWTRVAVITKPAT
jgi:hypothetical protein